MLGGPFRHWQSTRTGLDGDGNLAIRLFAMISTKVIDLIFSPSDATTASMLAAVANIIWKCLWVALECA